MKAQTLRDQTAAQLNDELLALRKEQFNLRMQEATGQLARPDQFKKVRRNIARVKTVLHQKSTQDKGEKS